jgi:RNA polymerase sigma-70 factor (ECF subfamily)
VDTRVDLYSFDDEFVRRLCAGDREAEYFLFRYFSGLLFSKLRKRVSTLDSLEDIIQETLLRALRAVCSPEGLRDNRTLGSFVNSICNNVLLEWFRKTRKHEGKLEDYPYLADPRDSAERRLMKMQERLRVHRALDSLDPHDAEILRAVFISERDKDEVCRSFSINRDYLRVLLFRAKGKFRAVYDFQPR